MDIAIRSLPMRCASAIAEEKKYHVHKGKSGKRWFVADIPNAADHIYVEDYHSQSSQGFGGRTLIFELVDGEKIPIKGPWHSNSHALLGDTGIDITNKHLISGIISRDISWKNGQATMVDVIYSDDGIVGTFDRVSDMARQLADISKTPVHYYARSEGGSVLAMEGKEYAKQKV